MPHIELFFPDGRTDRFPLNDREQIIGRAQAADITVPVGYVSSRHTSIQICAIVKDLNSLNGTWIGEEQVAEHVLRHGEEFHFGETNGPHFRVLLIDSDTDGDTRPGAGATIQVPRGGAAAIGGLGAGAPASDPSAELLAKVKKLEAQVAELDRQRHGLREELKARSVEDAGSEILNRPVSEPPDSPNSDPGMDAELDSLRKQLATAQSENQTLAAEKARLESELKAAQAAVSQSEISRDVANADRAAAGEPSKDSASDIEKDSASEAELSALHADLAAKSQQLADLSAERDRLKTELGSAQSAPAAVAAADPDAARAFLENFAQQADAREMSNPALLQTMQQREGFLSDAGFLLGKLFVFSRSIEKVVSETALSFRGGRAADGNATMLPAWQQSIKRSVQGYLMQGGDELKQEFEVHLGKLGQWFMACFWSYKKGSSQWWRSTYDIISPRAIQGQIKTHAWSSMLGGDFKKYWETYCELMTNLTPDIVEDEIDDHAAGEARGMIEGEDA